MKFKNNSNSPRIDVCIGEAEGLLSPFSVMLSEIMAKNDWKYNSGSGQEVYLKLINPVTVMNIYVVPKTRKTSSVAYFQNEKTFLYSDYVASARDKDIIGTILHEWAHHQGFNHFSAWGTSNYKTKAKCLYSVPYFLSENVGRWI